MGAIRSSLRDWCSEMGIRRAVAEVALARRRHLLGDQARRQLWPGPPDWASTQPPLRCVAARIASLPRIDPANSFPESGGGRPPRLGASPSPFGYPLVPAHARRIIGLTMHDWRWTNRSVALRSGDSDPVDAITEKARRPGPAGVRTANGERGGANVRGARR